MNSLVIHNLGEVEVLLEPGAFERRDTLLATAKEVQKVTDDFTKGLAVEAWQDLAGLSKGLEKTRVEIKAPVLALGRRIDDMARAFIQPVDAEVARINRLVTTYNAQQERARHEAERARQAEIDRLAREKQFNKRVAINAELRVARQDLERLSDGAPVTAATNE